MSSQPIKIPIVTAVVDDEEEEDHSQFLIENEENNFSQYLSESPPTPSWTATGAFTPPTSFWAVFPVYNQ